MGGICQRLLNSNSSLTGSLPHWRRKFMTVMAAMLPSMGHQRYIDLAKS